MCLCWFEVGELVNEPKVEYGKLRIMNEKASACMGVYVYIYTQQKKKVNTYSTLTISYTINSIDGKRHISYEREIPPL